MFISFQLVKIERKRLICQSFFLASKILFFFSASCSKMKILVKKNRGFRIQGDELSKCSLWICYICNMYLLSCTLVLVLTKGKMFEVAITMSISCRTLVFFVIEKYFGKMHKKQT